MVPRGIQPIAAPSTIAATTVPEGIKDTLPLSTLAQQITIKPEFEAMYSKSVEVVESIKKSFSEYGYDPRWPLLVWKKDGVRYLIDGHTRFRALMELIEEKAGVDFQSVWVEEIPSTVLKTPAQVMHYIDRIQTNRRSLTEKDLMYFLSRDPNEIENRVTGGSTWKNTKGRKRELIAAFFNYTFGQATISRALKIIDEKTPADQKDEIIKQIIDGATTIYQAHTRLFGDISNSKEEELEKISSIINESQESINTQEEPDLNPRERQLQDDGFEKEDEPVKSHNPDRESVDPDNRAVPLSSQLVKAMEESPDLSKARGTASSIKIGRNVATVLKEVGIISKYQETAFLSAWKVFHDSN
jgi:hypothetical protein